MLVVAQKVIGLNMLFGDFPRVHTWLLKATFSTHTTLNFRQRLLAPALSQSDGSASAVPAHAGAGLALRYASHLRVPQSGPHFADFFGDTEPLTLAVTFPLPRTPKM